MAKTAWGKAYSKKFKELKAEWDRKGTVNGRRAKDWKTAFGLIGEIARPYADKFGASPIGKGRKKKGKKTRPKKAKKARKKPRPKKAKKASRPKRPVAAKRTSRPRKARKASRPKAKKATRPRKAKKKRTYRRPVGQKVAKKRARTTKQGESLGRLLRVETSFGDVRITKGGQLKRVGRQLVMTNGNVVAPRAVIKRGKVAVKAIHRSGGSNKEIVETLHHRKLDLTHPGVLIIN